MKIKVGKLNLTIRKAILQDYQFCYRIAKRNMSYYIEKYWNKQISEIYRQAFDYNNTWIVIYDKKRVAYFRIKTEPKFLYFEDMQVSGLMRGKGVGTCLMKLIEKKAFQKNINKIQLTVFKSNPAKKLYQRLGYKVIQDKKISVLMEKKL